MRLTLLLRSRAEHPALCLAEDLAARGGQVVISVADEADLPAGAAAIWDVAAGAVTPRAA